MNLSIDDAAAACKPHAIMQTERSIPSPIFLPCLLGPERLLRVDFDTAWEPANYIRQALAGMAMK